MTKGGGGVNTGWSQTNFATRKKKKPQTHNHTSVSRGEGLVVVAAAKGVDLEAAVEARGGEREAGPAPDEAEEGGALLRREGLERLPQELDVLVRLRAARVLGLLWLPWRQLLGVIAGAMTTLVLQKKR